MRPLWVLGAGGHAKCVIDAALAEGKYRIAGVLDDHPGLGWGSVLGLPIRGPISAESVARFEIEAAVIAVGSNAARAEIARRFRGRLTWATVVHPGATLGRSTRVGEGTVILAGVVVQPDGSIGDHAILNSNATLGHDATIGDFAHVAPGVAIAGCVRVGAGTLLGVGSRVVPGLTIGAWATVGAGSVVLRDVPGRTTVVGVPARALPGPSSPASPALAPSDGERARG